MAGFIVIKRMKSDKLLYVLTAIVSVISLYGAVRATKICLDLKYDSIITYTGKIYGCIV